MGSRDLLYKEHLKTKWGQTISLLERISCAHLIEEIIPSPLNKGFRNRAKFRVYENRGTVRIEGTDPYEGDVAFEKALWILPAWARKVVGHVATYRKDYRHDFPFDGFELQLTHGKQQAHLAISVKRVFSEFFVAYAEDLWKTIPELIGVAIPSKRTELGDILLDHWLRGKSFLAHYGAFFQSNLSLTPRLLDKIAREAKEIDYGRIIDLYCGVGVLSLSFAKKETKIVGVESNKDAVECALKNALSLGYESSSFIHSKVENFVLSNELRPDSLVIINPPRSGCNSSVIDSVARQKPKNILLISCFLETHVRDLELWQEREYEVASISAFDMFPFTPFLETVTRLKFKH
ncbi:methyltransferase [Acidobacteriota bacterium]